MSGKRFYWKTAGYTTNTVHILSEEGYGVKFVCYKSKQSNVNDIILSKNPSDYFANLGYLLIHRQASRCKDCFKGLFQMKIVLISGDGAGAGKTWAARLFGQATWTLADGIRGELQVLYPSYNWYNRTQEYKNSVNVPEWRDGYANVRQVLLEYGQSKCDKNPKYWVERLCDKLKSHEELVQGVTTIAVDDVRKICELEHFRLNFNDVVHIHVENPDAQHEPEFDAEQLKRVADYVIKWRKS